jgi:superfamily II DNA or RNA helicase
MQASIKTPLDKLLIYQIPHVYQLYESLQNTQCILDASDTGTGKTYTTLALCYLLKLKPFIICPKSVINSWIDVAKNMDIEILGISNFEKLKGSKYYTSEYEIVTCPYMDIIKKDVDVKKKGKLKKIKDNNEYIFYLPNDCIIIIDEAHRCKNHTSDNSKLLIGLGKSSRKMILLSATITDKIECFKPFGVVFGFYDEVKKYKMWIRNKLKTMKLNIDKLKKELDDNQIILKIIHDCIFPHRGSRMKIKELGDLFPQNQIIAKCYYSDDHDQINELYKMINDAFLDLKDKEKRSHALGKIVKCRMRIEMFKVPIMLDLIDDALENGYSIAIFVNFKDTMNYLTHHLKEECSIISGDQSIEDRIYNIDRFQLNKTKIIISIIQAGGVGISLHDLNDRPRMSLISPCWSGSDMMQVFGRIHRAGSKSTALQRVIYIAESYEEVICKKINDKLSVLSGINDGDLFGKKLDVEELKEMGELDKINNNIIITTDEVYVSDDKKITSIKKKNFVKINKSDL